MHVGLFHLSASTLQDTICLHVTMVGVVLSNKTVQTRLANLSSFKCLSYAAVVSPEAKKNTNKRTNLPCPLFTARKLARIVKKIAFPLTTSGA